MIKNIVFDMGRVLLDYNPLKVCRHFTDREEEVELIGRELFFSEEWVLLDKGELTEEKAMERVRGRLPDDRLRVLADQCMTHWHEYNITPKEGMGELIRELKRRGYGIYLCSNASLRLRVYQDRIPEIARFDGTLVSAEEHLLKPDPAIYERLLEKFSLRAKECLFIDDLPENVEGAEKCGMAGYCFADGDVEKLRDFLYGSVIDKA